MRERCVFCRRQFGEKHSYAPAIASAECGKQYSFCICERQNECVKLLLSNGADVNAVCAIGFEPLYRAGTVETIALLVKAGAHVNVTTVDPFNICLAPISRHRSPLSFILQNVNPQLCMQLASVIDIFVEAQVCFSSLEADAVVDLLNSFTFVQQITDQLLGLESSRDYLFDLLARLIAHGMQVAVCDNVHTAPRALRANSANFANFRFEPFITRFILVHESANDNVERYIAALLSELVRHIHRPPHNLVHDV